MSVGIKQDLVWDLFQEIKIIVQPCFTWNRSENEDTPKNMNNERK